MDMNFLKDSEIFELAKLYLEKEIEYDLREDNYNGIKKNLREQRNKFFMMLKERRENKTGE